MHVGTSRRVETAVTTRVRVLSRRRASRDGSGPGDRATFRPQVVNLRFSGLRLGQMLIAHRNVPIRYLCTRSVGCQRLRPTHTLPSDDVLLCSWIRYSGNPSVAWV